MYILKSAENNKAVTEPEAKSKELSLAFKTEIGAAFKGLVLQEGKTTITGKKAIAEHLDKLGGEPDQWYHCNC